MDAPKKTSVGVGRIRHALGDGATEEQALRIRDLLRAAGILDGSVTVVVPDPPLREQLSGGDPDGEITTRSIVASDLVGVYEIAELAGVTSSAIVQRRDLPEPLVTLKQGRIWERSVIEAWMAGRKRR